MPECKNQYSKGKIFNCKSNKTCTEHTCFIYTTHEKIKKDINEKTYHIIVLKDSA